MFVDVAKVMIQAGKGGDGVVSFRHEIYVDKGGPDGGDGGRGGNVIFKASKGLNTLVDFRFKPELKAKPGVNGAKRLMRGRTGEDLIVKVPVGTVVKKSGEIIADLISDEEEVIIANGGSGGFGNAHFKSSTRQAPKMAELGEPGEAFEAELELKLLADVGLIGFPNAGKSTFLSVVSNARPEIADYAFTTLSPNLGVADIDHESLLIADIPGLIEGASEGKGLGDAFLRHVERTEVLLHMIDAYTDDIGSSYKTIRAELESYSTKLINRPEVIVLTKTDGMDNELIEMQVSKLYEVVPNSKVYPISSASKSGIVDVLRILKQTVDAERLRRIQESNENSDDNEELPVIELSYAQSNNAWKVTNTDGIYVVSGDKIERFAKRTNFDQYEAVNRLRDIMKKMGITHELIRRGASGESMINIGEATFPLIEQ